MHKYTALPPTFPNNCKTSCITLCTQHTATQGKRAISVRRGGGNRRNGYWNYSRRIG